MLRSFLLYLSEQDALRNLMTRYSLGRRLAGRFIAGEEIEDAVRAVRRLAKDGFAATLDYLGESVHEIRHAEEACRVYQDILDRLEAEGIRSHISVKLTQLGLAIDEALACRNLEAICERAARYSNFVRIDMESSAHTDATLRVFRAVNAPRQVLGIVIQAYLYRSQKDVDDLLSCGTRIRLCKGAYKEPPDIAFPRKAEVDANFVKLMENLLASGYDHAIASHDSRMIAATLNFARARGIGANRFEFQMLYGIRRRLQRDLLRKGYRVRVYVPYGRQWYPYFMRRLAERPANLLFLVKNLFRG
ncbi:MAG: proline dehydrogenase family protein [Acidobacteria bacterium]|nr:proline dehydrogenase family protein [Acidobacteriota bacterium]